MVKKKLLILTRYDVKGASSRVRLFEYKNYLESNFLSVKYNYFFNNLYLILLYENKKSFKFYFSVFISYLRRFLIFFSVFKYDIIIIEKEIFPYLPCTLEIFITTIGKQLISDFDDAWFLRYTKHSNPFVRFLLSRKIDKIFLNSSKVIVGSNFLYNYAKSLGVKNVHFLPSVVEISDYQKKISEDINGPIKIGWIGSPSSAMYLLQIEPILVRLKFEYKVIFIFMGSGKINFKKLEATYIPWTKESESNFLNNIDIGIMPLTNSEWEFGKCGYKILQYMASSTPVVASAIGSNLEIVDHGNDGYLCVSDSDWYTYLSTLIKNKDIRQKFINNALLKVANSYSFDYSKPALLKIILSESP